ncbi:MAG: ThuA domain-containing protein [Pseudomonadota bacterium]
MRNLLRLLLLLIGAAAIVGPAAAAARHPHVLIFSYSTGYRHASIEAGVAAVKAMGERAGMTMVASADPDIFSEAGLKAFDAIVFVSNTTKPKEPESEWFTGTRRDALQAFVHRGGGIVGIHAAADSHYNWPWFGRLMGGRFVRHPQGTPEGVVTIVDSKHPSTKGLARSVKRVDEWYYYDDFNPQVRLLVVLDPQSIGEKDVNPNPMSWSQEFEGGRVFYTGMGHTPESYAEPWFLKHLEGGLNWVLRR